MSQRKPRWYDIKTEVATMAIPLLKKMRKKGHSYPKELERFYGSNAAAKWDSILREMTWGLKQVKKNNNSEKDHYRVQNAVELFGYWFTRLWD